MIPTSPHGAALRRRSSPTSPCGPASRQRSSPVPPLTLQFYMRRRLLSGLAGSGCTCHLRRRWTGAWRRSSVRPLLHPLFSFFLISSHVLSSSASHPVFLGRSEIRAKETAIFAQPHKLSSSGDTTRKHADPICS